MNQLNLAYENNEFIIYELSNGILLIGFDCEWDLLLMFLPISSQ